ncbi:MAG: hypothetical protein ABJG78_19875 [Cyclobacteriaceae bacterium]
MHKTLVYLLIILSPVLSFSQSNEQDELVFQSAVDWLNRKLEYIYHDEVSQKWWLNRFYVNEEKVVTIKNTHTSNPRSVSIKEKIFHTRTFEIQNINPYQISMRKIERNQGRIVKGTLLELKTVKNRKDIHHKINDRTGTDVSFVQISLPSFMTDSIPDYAETVQAKLKEAIIAATKVYASGSLTENKNKIFEILEGSYTNDTGDEMQGTKRFDNVMSLGGGTSENYFVFTPADNLFYITTLSSEGVTFKKYQLVEGEKIVLQNIESEDDIITFETINSFTFNNQLYYRK